MELDVTHLMTGAYGNIAARPEVNLKATLELDLNDSTFKLWFKGPHDDLRGPIELYFLQSLPIGVVNGPVIDLHRLDLATTAQEVFFNLLEDNKILARVWLKIGSDMRYLEGDAWEDIPRSEEDEKKILDLGWLMPNGGLARNQFAKLRTRSHTQLRLATAVKS